jgi:hypothetical protein
MPDLDYRPAPRYQLHDENDESYNQKNVDQVTDSGTRESKAQSPQNQKYQNDCPKHCLVLLLFFPYKSYFLLAAFFGVEAFFAAPPEVFFAAAAAWAPLVSPLFKPVPFPVIFDGVDLGPPDRLEAFADCMSSSPLLDLADEEDPLLGDTEDAPVGAAASPATFAAADAAPVRAPSAAPANISAAASRALATSFVVALVLEPLLVAITFLLPFRVDATENQHPACRYNVCEIKSRHSIPRYTAKKVRHRR